MILKILEIILILVVLLKGVYMLLLFLQLDHYRLNSPFLYLETYYIKNLFIYAGYLSTFLFLKNNILSVIILILMLPFCLFKQNYIKKLKITKKVIRLLVLISIVILLPLFLIHNYYLLTLAILVLPFIIFMANLVLYPFEKLINNYYKKQAIRKLENNKPYVIEITGSFGKTTLKNIIYNLYCDKYLVKKTPASYNTPMGIAKVINNELLPITDILIIEAGATKKGDIKEITTMIKPSLGIITSVGKQHLNTFKTLDNVLKTKWELATEMEPNNTIILNYNSEPLNGLYSDKLNTIIVGGSYIYAKNIVINSNGLEFDIYINDQFQTHINTLLCGRFNVDNVLLAYATKLVLDKAGFKLTNEEFAAKINKTENIKNRQNKRIEKYYDITFNIIDDSFNSNEVGFISAVETLKKMTGLKMIITPGIVDTGKYKEEIANGLSKHLNDLDEVILINWRGIKQLKEQLNKEAIIYTLVPSYLDGLAYIINKYKDKNEQINLLIENDLPDNYLRR